MKKLRLIKCNNKDYEAIREIIKNKKYTVVTSNPEEGLVQELTDNLSNEELFLLYRKLRKRYLKRRNL